MRAHSPSVGANLAVVRVGCHPISLGIDESAQHVFVANRGNLNDGGNMPASVSVLDASTGAILQTIIVGRELQALAVDEVTGHVFVADRGPVEFSGPRCGEPMGPGIVTTLDTRTGAIINAVRVGTGPQGIAVDPRSHRVFVINQSDGSVSVLDASTGDFIRQTPVDREPIAVAIAPDMGRAFVANYSSDSVCILDTQSLEVVRVVKVGQAPSALAVDVEFGQVLVSNSLGDSISVLDALSGHVLGAISVQPRPSTIALDTPSRRAFVAHVAHYGTSSTRNWMSVLQRTPSVEGRAVDCTVLLGDHPGGIAIDEATGCVYVPCVGDGTLNVLDADASCEASMVLGVFQAGPIPRGVAVAAQTNRVFVISDVPYSQGQEANDTNGTVGVLDGGHITTVHIL